MSQLELEDLRVTYAGRHGPVLALDRYCLNVAPGSMTVLLGESGCGKSTALNAIAGLVHPDSGKIQLGDKVLFSRGGKGRSIEVSPDRRGIGMVFQSYALWPHMVVLENVMYPALRGGMTRAQAERAALEVLATVRCETLASRFPGELSGGQQQRVALARAMVGRPNLLLFDEPLSNLDAGLRRGLRDELARLHREIGFTGVYVTHDQSEALALGTRLAVMDGGKIVQAGSPSDIYERPANEFVARFFGANMVSGRTDASGQIETACSLRGAHGGPPDASVRVSFMPHFATIEPATDGPLQVVACIYEGSSWEIRLIGAGEEILIEQPATQVPPQIGTRARVRVAPERLSVFAA